MKAILYSLLALAVSAQVAGAKLCGDDVEGVDVPCACGDIVVSDLVLDVDPIVGAVCDGNGLVIRAADTQQITVNLAGKTLRGAGGGHGVMVVYGGGGGARITSAPAGAVLEGFDNGVAAVGGDLALLENVVIRAAVRDGIRARSAGLVLRSCQVVGSGRDGFALSGRYYLSVDNESRANKRHGFMLMGQGGDLKGNRAIDNLGAGFLVTGGGHEIEACVANGSGKNGLEILAANLSIRGCTAEGNGASGIEGHGAGWALANNAATGNGEHGIDARGGGMVDEGGNRGLGNGFALKDETPRQCLIGGVTCVPGAAP